MLHLLGAHGRNGEDGLGVLSTESTTIETEQRARPERLAGGKRADGTRRAAGERQVEVQAEAAASRTEVMARRLGAFVACFIRKTKRARNVTLLAATF